MIVSAVYDHKPSAILFVRQPTIYKLWYVSRWPVLDWQLDVIRDRPEASLNPRFCASMNPEYPSISLLRSDLVGEFDGKL